MNKIVALSGFFVWTYRYLHKSRKNIGFWQNSTLPFLSFTFVANKVWSHFRHENKYLMSFIISCLSHNRGFQIIYMKHDICSFLTRPLWNTPLVTYSREAHIGHERQTFDAGFTLSPFGVFLHTDVLTVFLRFHTTLHDINS